MLLEEDQSSPLTVIANRLPVTVRRNADEQWRVHASDGGLVSALEPVLRRHGGCWIGWSGMAGEVDGALRERLNAAGATRGYSMRPVALSGADVAGFYNGFSNRTLWPLLHNLLGQCRFDAAQWAMYAAINQRFARALAARVEGEGPVWVHDYHLMLVARELRKLGASAPIGFFLHIPFPPADTFGALPWAREVLDALLDFDLLGFQTDEDRDNFVQCATQLAAAQALRPASGLLRLRATGTRAPSGPGPTTCSVGTFPIGVDAAAIGQLAQTPGVAAFAAHLKAGIGDRRMIFGVDRLDYTKGLLHRMCAYQQLLRAFPDLHGKVTYVQYVVPGRELIPEYAAMHRDIERLVGEIVGEFTQPGWVPLHYVYRRLSQEQLLGYYRAADVALVTPIKDGMNLVAKEYCAARTDEDGVLVLSEFAGAAHELDVGAVLVNPYDSEALAASLHEACTMAPGARRARMRAMRAAVVAQDVFHWVDGFLAALHAAGAPRRAQAAEQAA